MKRLSPARRTIAVDLDALPLGPEIDNCAPCSAPGRIQATIDALDETLVRRHRSLRVWLIDYRGAEGERLALQLAITDIPDPARPAQDLDTAIAALDTRLSTVQGGPRLSS